MSNELEYDCDTLMAKSHLSDSEMAYLLRDFNDLKFENLERITDNQAEMLGKR